MSTTKSNTIQEIGEFGLIARIASTFAGLIPDGSDGIGDDCAVIALNTERSIVVTTDMLVEGVHFLRDKISARELGYKSMAVNLSDIAAMGATAHSAFLSISLPGEVSLDWCEEFIVGLATHSVPLLGGDTTKSLRDIVINITVLGEVRNDHIKRRCDARAEDYIYVTGMLGDSAGGLRAVLEGVESAELIRRHNMPPDRRRVGALLGSRAEVGAMMDISDGLASDLRHILKASGVGARIELQRIPISEELREASVKQGWNALALALTGGEDYELLLTSSVRLNDIEGLIEIGSITTGSDLEFTENGTVVDLNVQGFSHF